MKIAAERIQFIEEFQCKSMDNSEWRDGQALFNTLPNWAAAVVATTSFDPYHKSTAGLGLRYWTEWIDEHLIFDEQGLLAVFNNDEILAERPS